MAYWDSEQQEMVFPDHSDLDSAVRRRSLAERDIIKAAKEVEEYLPDLEGVMVSYRLGRRLAALGKKVRALKELEEG